MVVFKKVEFENFMSYEKAKLDLDNRGLVLIEGDNKSNESVSSNGAGKTTSVSAITYAIYGKTERGLKADDVVNNKVKKNTNVKLTFTIGNDTYRIERYRKDKTNKNKVKLFCNEQEITGSTNDVTDKQILDLFGIEFNTYLNSIMYGQGDIPMFSQATDKGKKEILESITKTHVYKHAQEVAKEKVKEVEQEQNLKQNDIEKLGYQLESKDEYFQKEIDTYNEQLQRINQIKEDNKQKEKQKEVEKEQIVNKIEELKHQFKEVPNDTFEFSDNYKSYQQAREKLSQKYKEVQDTLNTIKGNEKGIQSEINNLNRNLNQLDTKDTCPVCGSPIDNSHKLKEQENIKNQISIKQEELQDNIQEQQRYEQALQVINSKDQEILELMKVEEEQEKTHKDSIYQVTVYNNNLQNNISTLNNQLTQLDIKYQQQSTNGLEPKEPSREEHEKEKEKLEKSIDNIKKSIVKLETTKVNYQEAIDAFSNKGIRSVVLDFITPFLNEKANEYLQILSGSDIEIEFLTQVKNSKGELKDKFDVIVKNSKGGQSYKSNSAGEQKRIDLAISFAIQDLIMSKDDISTNIALYDECFDGLDTIGCENVIKLLKDRLSKVSTIFVITHNETLKPLFEKTIRVVKEKGISKLED